MDGKIEGQSALQARPILLFVRDLDLEVRRRLETGLEKIGLDRVGIFDIKKDKTQTDGPEQPAIPKSIIASGYEAFDAARLGLSRLGTVIYAVPEVGLWIPDQKEYKGLGKLVADFIKEICDGIELQEEEETAAQPKGVVNIDPRDAMLPPPKDPLTLEEVKKIFQERFPKDPYVFSSNGIQVGVYLNDPPGNMPIEFSLEEFYTILKLVEVTRAKTIQWRTLDDEEESHAIPK